MLFLSKINYKIQDVAGKWKAIGEQFLHDGVTYGEVETQLATLLEGRVADYTYDIAKAKYFAIYDPFLHANFYKVTVEEEEENEYGVTKKTTNVHLVVAEDVPTAEARCQEYMKTWTNPGDVIGADKTKILGFWHPHNQQWKDDFLERMQALKEAGNESKPKNEDPAQTTIFDKDGKPKRYDNASGVDEAADVNLDQFSEATANYQASQKPAWKRAEEARAKDDTPWADVDSRSDNLTPFTAPSAEQISDVAAMQHLEAMEEADDLDTLGDGNEPTTTGPKKNIAFFTPDKPSRKPKA